MSPYSGAYGTPSAVRSSVAVTMGSVFIES
jgi:hypothetical protein